MIWSPVTRPSNYFGFILLLFTLQSFAQSESLSGKVSTKTGDPLQGATVKIKGTSRTSTTNEQGIFSFSNVPGSGTLTISYVGYLTYDVSYSSGKEVVVSLTENINEADAVIVTGVFDKRTALQSSIAISTLKSEDIRKIASNSAADLLSYTPGVYVNSAVGEINNTVFSRGVNANQFSVVGGNGYYYVSLMEDGLPVSNLSSGNIVADYFYRADATLSRLEAVRGGSASITGANAPGGIFNYVSKTGQNPSNEISAKFGLEGDGRNPYYRIDGNVGGKLGDKGWFYNVGGFYRHSQGARSPGYAQNKGGQIKVNLVKTLTNGTIKIYAKYLNDKNGLPQNLPAQNYDKPQIVPGFGIADTYMLPAGSSVQPLWGTSETYTFDPTNLIHPRDLSLGTEVSLNLKNGWTVTNNIKASTRKVSADLTIMSSPTPLDGFFTYALTGIVGPGTFSFKDRSTGMELASVTATPGGRPFNYAITKNNLPANSVMNNGVLFNFSNMSRSKLNEIMDQLIFNKKAGKHSISFGTFLASSHVATDPNGTTNTSIRPIQNRPLPLDITWTLPNGVKQQVTNPQGYAQLSGGRFSFNSYEVTQTQLSGFLADGIQLSSNLYLDMGVRFDRIIANGANIRGKENPNAATGGVDGNPLTLYDNFFL